MNTLFKFLFYELQMLDILYININVFWNVDIYVYIELLIYIDYVY